jgi:hypothetical protein
MCCSICYGEEGVSSVHQRIPKPSYLGYSVSKGGMANLTTTLALEYARQGIRLNRIRRLPRALVVGVIGAGARCGLVPQRWGCLPGERDTNLLERIAVGGEDPDDDRADRDC